MVRPRTISDEQILDAARECLLQHGPSVSMEVIAAELGVSAQAVLKRFHSKQELVVACLCPGHPPQWVELIEQGPDDRPLSEQLSELLTELAVFFTDIVRRMELLRWSGISPQEILSQFDEPPPVRNIQAISAWLQRAWERKLIRSVDFDATAMFILTSMHGPAMLREFLGRPPTGHSQEAVISQYVDLLLRGLVDGPFYQETS